MLSGIARRASKRRGSTIYGICVAAAEVTSGNRKRELDIDPGSNEGKKTSKKTANRGKTTNTQKNLRTF